MLIPEVNGYRTSLMCGPNDSLKLRYQNDADTLNFQCESSADDRIADFDLKLMQIESEHMEIPEQQFKVVVKMPSAEFLKVCRDSRELDSKELDSKELGVLGYLLGVLGYLMQWRSR